MSELIDRQALLSKRGELAYCEVCPVWSLIKDAPTVAASPWHRVEDGLPKESGEYIVAYHPCYWDDVDTEVTKVGIDNFRGRSAWAKKKFQRVTHWMEKPEPPREDADEP